MHTGVQRNMLAEAVGRVGNPMSREDNLLYSIAQTLASTYPICEDVVNEKNRILYY